MELEWFAGFCGIKVSDNERIRNILRILRDGICPIKSENAEIRNLLRILWDNIRPEKDGRLESVIFYGFCKSLVSLRGATFVAKVAKTGGLPNVPRTPSTAGG